VNKRLLVGWLLDLVSNNRRQRRSRRQTHTLGGVGLGQPLQIGARSPGVGTDAAESARRGVAQTLVVLTQELDQRRHSFAADAVRGGELHFHVGIAYRL